MQQLEDEDEWEKRRQPPFNQRTEQNVCLLAPSSTVEMGGNNYGTILAIPVH